MPNWMRIGIPGEPDAGRRPGSGHGRPTAGARRLPRPRAAAADAGGVLVATDQPIPPETTNAPVQVLDSDPPVGALERLGRAQALRR